MGERVHATPIGAMNAVWREALLIAFLPCFFLFDLAHTYEGMDWAGHIWAAGYIGAYFRDHLTFPDLYNTREFIGISFPTYYATTVFKPLGLLSAIFHPHIAVLIGAYILYSLQYAVIALLLSRLDFPRWFASMIAVMVTFAIYPLSDLYSRGAFPEFFAITALTIAVAAFLLSIVSSGKTRRSWYAAALTMFGVMGGAHPITLLHGGLFMAVLCPLILLVTTERIQPRKTLIISMLGIPLTLLMLLAPWLYVQYTIAGELGVVKDKWFALYSEDIDWIWTRITPILFDRRVWHTPFKQLNSPYLDMQANVFLFGMALVLIACVVRRCGFHISYALVASAMMAVAGLSLWISVSRYAWNHVLPTWYRIIQLPFHLVVVINLALLCLLFCTGLWLKGRNAALQLPQWARTATVVLCTAAACAFFQKAIHITTHQNAAGRHTVFSDSAYRQSTLSLPWGMYWVNAGTTSGLFEPQTGPVVGEVHLPLAGDSFGTALPATIHADTPGWYKTNIYAFPWNRVLVDGNQATPHVMIKSKGRLYGYNQDLFSVYLPAGDHSIVHAFTPPLAWTILNGLATCAWFLLIAYTGYCLAQAFISSRSASQAKNASGHGSD